MLELIERREVLSAEVADVVCARVLFMLLEGAVVREESFAASTVSHLVCLPRGRGA